MTGSIKRRMTCGSLRKEIKKIEKTLSNAEEDEQNHYKGVADKYYFYKSKKY